MPSEVTGWPPSGVSDKTLLLSSTVQCQAAETVQLNDTLINAHLPYVHREAFTLFARLCFLSLSHQLWAGSGG